MSEPEIQLLCTADENFLFLQFDFNNMKPDSLWFYQRAAESQVVGPHQPVVALVDDDVILPCHVEPAEDVTAEILEWTRSDLNPRFVHVWRSASDAATSPVISLSGIDKNRGGVVLQCESAGWYPEPELLWLDGEGNLLSAGPTETLRGPDDLYTVSSRVTVEKRHSNNITCRVQQKKISQNRETHIHVPEDFFEVPSSSPSVIIGLAVCLALCIMLLISSAAVLLCRMKKHKNNRSPEDQTDVGDAEVPLRGSSPKTKNKTSCWPITWTSKLQEEQKRREKAEKNLQDIKEEMINSKLEKAEFIQKRMQTFLTLDSELQLEKNTEIIDQLKQVKEASEKLKNQLENKNPEMSKSETELDEIIQRLMQTFPTLESKLSGNISQAQEEKQKMERLRNELDSTKQQLQQEKTAAEDLKKKNREKVDPADYLHSSVVSD
ncbi:selection and upkeep of intraepithelial T-cells protein 6-like [Astatotilapia calliptera]|uniref:selection and upkeep of intraepithelial T-cells protein 6-like n=1 Tax=Astatotilapia calliptera TaxID=8154 RepID=UPI000E40B9C4|nr:selection and upkeep of intraepithelial T-cells protein 6-like [Astatotilapia calliptera]